jgi:hypothetical protein
MKKSLFATCAIALSLAMTGWAEVTVRTVTAAGAIEQFAPDSELVIRTETAPQPIRYFVTRETRFVDETGTPIAVEKIVKGVPVDVEYMPEGNRMIVSRVVVHKAPVVEKRRTTTTTTRKLTHEEKEALEKEKERLEDLEDDDD